MRVECTREKRAQVQVLRPHGVMAGGDAEAFERQVRDSLESGTRDIVIDISQLAFVDSRGLEALVGLAELQIRNGRTLKLAGEQPIVQEVLELTELSPLFEMHRDVKGALEGCQ
ncbi:MAG: STAS domain-containing protein [Phycisphaerae bacterium]|nr:STAS domain-containing protein [Phycisphaerae bacterium]